MTGAAVRRGTILSFDSSAWTAEILLDGADSEALIAVGQWVASGMMTVAAEVAVLVFGETDTDDAVVLGPYGAVGQWDYPPLAGLTAGQPLRAISAAGAAFGALDLANTNAVTGTLASARLGTTQTPTFGGLNLGSASGAATGQLKATNTGSVQPLDLNGSDSATSGIVARLNSNTAARDAAIQFTDNVSRNLGLGMEGATGDFVIWDGRSPGAAGTERFRVIRSGGVSVSNNLIFAAEGNTLANLGTLLLGNFRGLILISNATDNSCQLVIVKASGTVTSVADQGLGANLGSDAGATLAVFYSAPNWTVKNRYGSAKIVRVQVIGN